MISCAVRTSAGGKNGVDQPEMVRNVEQAVVPLIGQSEA